VENLVSQSLQLFELEHLHQLVLLAGQFCDYEPVAPINGKKMSGFKKLEDQIQTRKTLEEFSLEDPFAEVRDLTRGIKTYIKISNRFCDSSFFKIC